MGKKKLKSSFIYSFKKSIPVLIGFFPVGVAYGILMSKTGYSFIWSALTSFFVYAGSLQMLMVSFFKLNMPLITIAITALLLNSRHIFYGISFIEKFRSYGFWRWFLIFALTDECYSLMCSYNGGEDVSEKWVSVFSAALLWIYWITFSALGGLAGSFITFNTTGIDFALTALFTVILVEQIKTDKTHTPAYIAIPSSILCIIVFGADNFLLPSLLITVAALILMKSYIHVEGKQ